MSSTAERIYHRLPPALQNVAVSLKGLHLQWRRYGPGWEALFDRVRARAHFSDSEMRAYRRWRLGECLRRASQSDFWSERFDRFGVSPEGEPVDEVDKLPILDKETARANADRIRIDDVDGPVLPIETSGTTGSGLSFCRTRDAVRERFAVWWRYRGWHGVTREDWHAYFGGSRVCALDRDRPPFWRVDAGGRRVLFSNYHLAPRNLPSIVEALSRWELPWLHGYPSSLNLLARAIIERDLDPPPSIRIVTTGAENLLDYQRANIRRAFDVPVRQHYGLAEGVANLSECERGRLHVDEDFAHVEFVSEGAPEGLHRLVGTNWINPAFPLLRYDTGDLVEVADDQTCACGRPGRIVERIEGRREDYVVVPSGARIGRLDHIFKDFSEVRAAQIYQPDRSRVVLRVVPGDGYADPETRERLVAEARDYLGDEIDIEVQHREEIERTDSGKLRFVVSELDEMKV
ncbi:MAG: phenylacetate--CoA ligase family protein [Bradymonadaceae bacterium]